MAIVLYSSFINPIIMIIMLLIMIIIIIVAIITEPYQVSKIELFAKIVNGGIGEEQE